MVGGGLMIWSWFVVGGGLMIGSWFMVGSGFMVGCRGMRGVWSWMGDWGGLVTITSHTVDAALVIAGAEILIESCPVAAVECVLLPILVAEVINLASSFRVSVVSARVATTAVKACVSLVDGHRQGLHCLGLVRLLLQQDGTCGGWGVVGCGWVVWGWGGAVGSHWSHRSRAVGSHWSWRHVIHGIHLLVVLGVKLQ